MLRGQAQFVKMPELRDGDDFGSLNKEEFPVESSMREIQRTQEAGEKTHTFTFQEDAVGTLFQPDAVYM